VGEMIFCPQGFGCFLKVKCGTGAMKPAFCCFKSGPDITRAAQHGIELFTGLGGWQVRDLAADGFNRKIRRLCKPLRIIGIGNNQRRRRQNHSIFLIVYRPKIFLLLQRNSSRLADDTDIGMLDQCITQQVWVDPASRWKKKPWIINGDASESACALYVNKVNKFGGLGETFLQQVLQFFFSFIVSQLQYSAWLGYQSAIAGLIPEGTVVIQCKLKTREVEVGQRFLFG